MKEIVAGEYPTAEAESAPGGGGGAGGRLLDGTRLAARSQIVWGEHCSECSYPVCYASCSFYDPRPDLHCRRFAGGIADAGDGRMRIRFRKWGKLEGRGPAALRAWKTAARRERLGAELGRTLALAPLPMSLKRSLSWRLDARKTRRTASARGLELDAFVVEGWTHDGAAHPFTLTFLQGLAGEEGAATWQAHLELGPEPSRHVLPVDQVAASIRLDRPFLVQLEPVGEAEGIEITLSLIDFVAFHDPDEAWPAVRAPLAPARTTPSPLAKVLVWDLDETFWTGTLAEDGPGGVAPRPEAVAALKALDARGVLQSIASKNDAAEAREALRRFGLHDYFLHPEVGWGPKSEAVSRIAAALDLGLDSLVFIDDQPFERAEVAAAHPQVRTLDHHAVAALLDHPWFDHPATAEAARRRSLYQAEAERGRAAQASGGDYLGFLQASRLQLDIRPLDAADAERVHELSQRTNQLNFTGAKFTRAEVAAMLGADGGRYARLTLRCRDAWGDYGLIGFADLDLSAGELTHFFMSCRVQRKRVEHAAFAHMADRLRAAGHARFAVRFHPTERNGASGRLLEELGFRRDGEGWSRPLAEPFPDAAVVEVLEPASAEAA